jgi:surface protein
MFYGAKEFNQDIGNWNVKNVHSMSHMFLHALSFNQYIGEWDVHNVKTMNNMFAGAIAFNQDIGNWKVSNVTNMSGMFSGAKNFNGFISYWDVSNVRRMENMFRGVQLTSAAYSTILQDWSQRELQENVTFSAPISHYNQDVIRERQYIIDTFHWNIQDGGLVQY